MLQKFRLLFTTSLAAILLIACGSETNENVSGEKSLTDTAEVLATETMSEESDTEDANSENTTASATEEDSVEEDISEEVAIEDSVEEDISEEVADSADVETKTAEEISPSKQSAIEGVLAVTGLDIEAHTYNITDTTEDYIQVEIYEKTEDEHTTRVGTYRYFPETEAVQVNDYLTGEFIPYETIEDTQ